MSIYLVKLISEVNKIAVFYDFFNSKSRVKIIMNFKKLNTFLLLFYYKERYLRMEMFLIKLFEILKKLVK